MPEAKPPVKKPPNQKGPMGIPIWGWIAGAGLGLIIGFILIRNRGSSSTDSGTSSTPLTGGNSSGSGGGVVASPPPTITTEQQIPPDDTGGDTGDTSGETPGGGDTTTGGDTSTPTSPYQVAPNNPPFFGQSGGTNIAEPESFQPTGAGGLAVQTALASGSTVAAATVPSIIANPQPPTGNISPYSPNLPRHALNIAAG